LFRNSSVNDIGKFLRRPDDPHNCDFFILKLIRSDCCKVGEQRDVKLLCLLFGVIPPVTRDDNVRRALRQRDFLFV